MADRRTQETTSDTPIELQERNWKRFAIRVCGGLLILAVLFTLLPRDQFMESLSRFSSELWLAGVSLYLCLHLIGVAKWRMLINAAGAGLTFPQVARCYYYGLFGNTFLPSVVGGDVIRAGLALKMSRSRSGLLFGSVVDRVLDSVGLITVAGIGALFLPMALSEDSSQIFMGILLLGLAGAAIVSTTVLLFPVARLSFSLRRKLVKLRRAIKSLWKQPGTVLLALASVMTLQTAQVIMNFWLGRLALIFNATLLMWLFVWPLAKLAAMAPLTQGGIGVREAAQGALFYPLGVSMEKAVATGLIFQAIVIGGNLLGGVVALLLHKFVPSAGTEYVTQADVATTPGQSGVRALMITGVLVFMGVNATAVAVGTGAASAEWVRWMDAIPGLDASFAGSIVGFIYGGSLGFGVGYASRRLKGADDL